MKQRIWLILMVAVLVLALVVGICACKPEEEEKPALSGEISVDAGTDAVYRAMRQSAVMSGTINQYYMAFTLVRQNEAALDTLYEFKALFDITAENLLEDKASRLSFVVRTDLEDKRTLEAYYLDGTLYLNHNIIPSASISSISLSQIGSIIKNQLADNHSKVNTLGAMLPTLGNLIFDSCIKEVTDAGTQYRFALNQTALVDSLTGIAAEIGLGCTADDLRAFLNVTEQNTEICFTTTKKGGVECLDGAAIVRPEDKLLLKDFSCEIVSPANVDVCTVPMPNNLQSFAPYQPSNWDIAGTISLDFNSVNLPVSVGAHEWAAALHKQSVLYDFVFKSHTLESGWEFTLSLYRDGNRLLVHGNQEALYVDAQAFGLGAICIPLSQIATLRQAMQPEAVPVSSLDTQAITALLLDALLDSDADLNNTRLFLSGSHADALINALVLRASGGTIQTPFLLGFDGLTINLNTSTNKLRAITLDAELWGSHIVIEANAHQSASGDITENGPIIGADVDLDDHTALLNATSITDRDIVTATMQGNLRSSTQAAGNTALVEGLIYSLSGDEITLNGEIDNYILDYSMQGDGTRIAIAMQCFTQSGVPVCTLYYHQSTPDMLYVVYPEGPGGITDISSHHITAEHPFREWERQINGNAPIGGYSKECTLSNQSNGMQFSFTKRGANGMLSAMRSIFPGLSWTDELTLDRVILETGNGASLRLAWAKQAFIEWTVSSFELSDKSIELSVVVPTPTEVALLDDNHLPDTHSVSILGRSTTLSLSRLGIDWQYDHIPSFGMGKQLVNAYAPVLGSRITLPLYVNCDALSRITLASASTYLSGSTFTFPRYDSAVSPVELLTHQFANAIFNLQDVSVTKPIVWYIGQTPIEDAVFDTPSASYTLTPAVRTFFDRYELLTANTYQLNLSGDRASGIVQDTPITISAYQGKDPFRAETYGVPQIMVGTTPVTPTRYTWDVTSIRATETGAPNATLQQQLKQALYMVDGSYYLDLVVYDAVGAPLVLPVRVTVIPRAISHITIDASALIDGVTYVPEADETKPYVGTFEVEPLVYDAFETGFAFAERINCYFGTDATPTSIGTINWNTQATTLPIYSTTEHIFTIGIGHVLGGVQRITLRYIVKGLSLSGIQLIGTQGETTVAIGEPCAVSEDGVSLSMLQANPYDFVMPSGIRILTDGAPIDKAIDWALELPEALYNKNGVVYYAQTVFFNLPLSLAVSFAPKIVTGNWGFVEPDPTLARYVPAVDGKYIQDGSEFIPALAGSRPEDIFALAPVVNVIYYRDNAGDYVQIDNEYIPYDSANLAMEGLDRYGAYYVRYKETTAEQSFLLIDPNIVPNFQEASTFPARVKVRFIDNPSEEVELPAYWDLTPIASATVETGYTNTLALYIEGGQFVANVNVEIFSAKPEKAYIRWAHTIDEGGDVVLDEANSSDTLFAHLLAVRTIDEKQYIIANAIDDIGYIHSLCCGCSDEGCLGKVYFAYEKGMVNQSGEFAITAWKNLDAIRAFYLQKLSEGIAVEKIDGVVDVIAMVGNIETTIHISIQHTEITEKALQSLPYVVSTIPSAGTQVYSMQTAIGASGNPTLTVDPYIASPFLASNYPRELKFTVGGVRGVTQINAWDLASIDGITPYQGASATVYALIDTPMGAQCRIPVELTILPRLIDSVYINGNPDRSIFINLSDPNPMGIIREKDGIYDWAYIPVTVQFAGDDARYNLTLRYDTTGIQPSWGGALLKSGATVQVGSNAGGWQVPTMSYDIYSANATVFSITYNEVLVYHAAQGIAEFGTDALDDTAWKHLTEDDNTLVVRCGDTAVNYERTFAKESGNLRYEWQRDGDIMTLVFYNADTLFADKIGSVRHQISTDTNRKLNLPISLLYTQSFENQWEYDPVRNVQALIEAFDIHSAGKHIADDELEITIVHGTTRLADTAVLSVGNYQVVISVKETNKYYQGSVSLALQIVPRYIALSAVSIRVNNEPVPTSTMLSEGYTKRQDGKIPALSVVCTVDDVLLVWEYREGSTVIDAPTTAGIYTARLICTDANYQLETNLDIQIIITL